MAWDQAQDGWGQAGSAAPGGTTTGAVIEILRYEMDEGSGSFLGSTATVAEASGGTSMVLTAINSANMTDISIGGVGLNIEGVAGNFPSGTPGASFVPDDLFSDALNLATDELLVGVEILSAAPSVATQGVYLVAYQSGTLGTRHVTVGAIYDGAIKRGLYDVLAGTQDVAVSGAFKSWMWLHMNAAEIRNLYSDAELASPFDAAATTQQVRTLLTQDPTYTLTWTGSGLRVAIVGLTTGTTHDIQIGTIVVQRIRHDAAVV